MGGRGAKKTVDNRDVGITFDYKYLVFVFVSGNSTNKL